MPALQTKGRVVKNLRLCTLHRTSNEDVDWRVGIYFGLGVCLCYEIKCLNGISKLIRWIYSMTILIYKAALL
jgi:hypothetical protein